MPRRLLPLLALIALASAQVWSQQVPPTFRTEANYVRVDIYPTKDGAPVANEVERRRCKVIRHDL